MSKISKIARLAFLRTYASALRRRTSPLAKDKPAPTVAIVPPAAPGGLGDDALLNSLASGLVEKGHTQVLCATYGENDDWGFPSLIQCTRTKFPSKHAASWIKFLRQIRRCRNLVVVGADMIDGYYGAKPSLMLLQAADLGARMGLSTTIVGASFNGAAPAAVNQRIRSLSPEVQLLARDPVSKQRLDLLRGRPSTMVADVAFLLPPAAHANSVIVRDAAAWISQQRKRGARLILGCNVNLAPVARAGHASESILECHAAAIAALNKRHEPIGVVFFSHDRREPFNDVLALRSLRRMIPSGIATYSGLLETNGRASEMKAVAALCDLLLAGRMHLAIGALGSGVPAGCIGYQGKCEGLYQHFGLNDMVQSVDDAVHPERLTAWLCAIAEQRQALAAQIQERLPRVIELARLNLAHLS